MFAPQSSRLIPYFMGNSMRILRRRIKGCSSAQAEAPSPHRHLTKSLARSCALRRKRSTGFPTRVDDVVVGKLHENTIFLLLYRQHGLETRATVDISAARHRAKLFSSH